MFADEIGGDFTLELGDGMNVLVGRNNCGKSNVLRSVALARPSCSSRTGDRRPVPDSSPTQLSPCATRVVAPKKSTGLLAAAQHEARGEYELPRSYADGGEVMLEVSFPPTEHGGHQRAELLHAFRRSTRGVMNTTICCAGLARLREAVRFVLISSGESIESVLEGNFREILHSVIRAYLSEHFERAEQSRQEYIHGLQDELLAPLRDRLASVVGGLFPEIDGVTLSPEVSGIDATLFTRRGKPA